MFLLTLPEKLLPQPPDLLLCQDISRFCRILKKFIVSSISLEEVAIIIKFLIALLYTKKQPHRDSFSLFLLMVQPCSQCIFLEKISFHSVVRFLFFITTMYKTLNAHKSPGFPIYSYTNL